MRELSPARIVALALAAFLLSRALFLLHSPDWGLLNYEHCFNLSAPAVHAELEAELGPVPYWLSEPNRYRYHYFRGLYWNGRVIGAAAAVLGSETVLPVKVVGILFALLFVAALAWMLSRIWPRGGPGLWVPLWLCAFSPTAWLWITLTPMGAFTEGHVFLAPLLLMLPAALRGELRTRWLVVAGLVTGVATAYAFVLLYSGLWLLALYLWCSRAPLRQRLQGAAAFCAATAASLLPVAPWSGIALKLREGLHYTHDDSGLLSTMAANLKLFFSGEILVSGGYSELGFLRLLDRGSPLAWTFAMLWGALVLAALLYGGRRALPLIRRDEAALGDRVAGAAGLWVAGYFLGYLAFDTQTAREVYLAPAYPFIFLAAGSLAARVWEERRGAALAMMGLGAVLTAGGWGWNLSWNARAPQRPPQARCDAITLAGYFAAPLDEHGEAGWDFASGETRCNAAHPGNTSLCAMRRYMHEFRFWEWDPSKAPRCDEGDVDRQLLCARAYGAAMEAPKVCFGWWNGVLGDAKCDRFEGAQKAACIAGAHQGVRHAADDCQKGMRDRCHAMLADGADEATARARFFACSEQIAYFAAGAPPLPIAEALPERCRDWPAPWQGLCAEADARASVRAAPDQASCEAVYLADYAEALPDDESRLRFDHCLSMNPPAYPWCAIGVARQLGRTQCRWEGRADFDETR